VTRARIATVFRPRLGRAGWFVLPAILALAQTPQPGEASEISVRIPASIRSWEISDSSASATVRQALAPITVTVPLSSELTLVLRSGAQRGSMESGDSRSLTGASDTRAALLLSLLDGRLMLHGGVNAPTGVRELTIDEQTVAIGLASPHLGFRQRDPGHGFDVGGGASFAVRLFEAWTWGLGGGYLHHGSFRPTQGGASIRPGAELSVSTGVDWSAGESTKLSLDLTRRIYGQDDGRGLVYEEPGTWEGVLAWRSGTTPWHWNATGYAVRKEEGGTVFSPFSGWHLGGAGALLRSVNDRVMLGAGGEAAYFRGEQVAGDAERPTANAYGGGPAARLRLSDAIVADAQGFLLAGDEGDLSLEGWDARLSLQFLFSRP
jgi:hypothetical protein